MAPKDDGFKDAARRLPSPCRRKGAGRGARNAERVNGSGACLAAALRVWVGGESTSKFWGRRVVVGRPKRSTSK